jgi:hypothetical protein
VAVEAMHKRGIDATQVDLSDLGSVQSALDGVDHVGGLLLLDVLEHLVQPQDLMVALSTWALENGRPLLVVSVPNVSHFDVALRLLAGRWIPSTRGLLDATHIRFFTEELLTNLVHRTGWEIVARDNFCTLRSDQYDTPLADAMPPEMIGALRVLSDAENPNAAVQQFVWALRPVPLEAPPSSYLEAVGPIEADVLRGASSDMSAVRNYLASAGILASEAARRAVASGYGHREVRGPGGSGVDARVARLKQAALREAYKTPQRKQAFQRAYGWFR